MTRTGIALAVALAASTANAQLPYDCAGTYDARLADAKRALAAFDAWMAEHERARPALEYFEAHCRFLTELERTVRKVDDPAAFVCDGKGKRPKVLTSALVLQYSTIPTVGHFQANEHNGPNHVCSQDDATRGASLVLAAEMAPLQKLELMCLRDESARCVNARAAIAAAKAQSSH